MRERVFAWNEALRRVSTATGTHLADLAAHPVTGDPRLWSEDRLHANSLGHARIAEALAHALGLPGSDATWATPLPPAGRPGLADMVRREAKWGREHLWPWLVRHARGQSSGDGRAPKRPDLSPWRA